MKKFVSSLVALILFGSFAATSGAFASTDDGAQVAMLVDSQTIAPEGKGEEAQDQQERTNAAEPCGTQTMQCTVTWKADSDVCKSQNTTSNCTTKYQGEHATLQEAKERCEHIHGVTQNSGVLSCGPCWAVSAQESPVERCKKACDVINLICIARCRRGDKPCMNRCNQELGKCLKDCEK